jgi:hypothetical protein
MDDAWLGVGQAAEKAEELWQTPRGLAADPELPAVIGRWNTMPAPLKAAILAMLRPATGE